MLPHTMDTNLQGCGHAVRDKGLFLLLDDFGTELLTYGLVRSGLLPGGLRANGEFLVSDYR